MKELFIVANNAFTVKADEGLRAWERLRPRYCPFAADAAAADTAAPVLEVDIAVGELPEREAEMIYEPVHAGLGFLASRASRLPDGGLAIEFMHTERNCTRLRMEIPPELNRASILIPPGGDADDVQFLTHALMIAYMIATCGNGTLIIHASAVVYRGRAYLFQGKSGTGKSTHAALWLQNIEGAELLNDDNPIIRFDDVGVAMAYGSPWSGKTRCYRNAAAPIGALVRIVRAGENRLGRLGLLSAYASLTASVSFLPFLNERLRAVRHLTIERLVASVPCCEMHCRPDAEAAQVCREGVVSF